MTSSDGGIESIDPNLELERISELQEWRKKRDDNKKRMLAKKLAAMTPTERHAYNCTETFKFKKGTEKFNDCVLILSYRTFNYHAEPIFSFRPDIRIPN